MLNEQEKAEFVKDGYSARRRASFSAARKLPRPPATSLDDYIRFLMAVQRVFPEVGSQRRKKVLWRGPKPVFKL